MILVLFCRVYTWFPSFSEQNFWLFPGFQGDFQSNSNANIARAPDKHMMSKLFLCNKSE